MWSRQSDLTPATPSGERPAAPRLDSPYFTTAEAAVYLRFRSPSAIRSLVARGELTPSGAGARGTLLFRVEELDRFVEHRGRRRVVSPRRHAAPRRKGAGDATEGSSDEVSGCQD